MCAEVEVFLEFELDVRAVELEAELASSVLLDFALEDLLRVRGDVALEGLSEGGLIVVEMTELGNEFRLIERDVGHADDEMD